MINDFPSSDCPYPLLGGMKRTCFLKNFITRPNILVGDYTYYDDETDVRNFEKNILYHFDFLGDKLIIGKFCQIAGGATFLMNGMWHIKRAISTYPFVLFSKTCAEQYPKNPIIPSKAIPLSAMTFGSDIIQPSCRACISATVPLSEPTVR